MTSQREQKLIGNVIVWGRVISYHQAYFHKKNLRAREGSQRCALQRQKIDKSKNVTANPSNKLMIDRSVYFVLAHEINKMSYFMLIRKIILS